MPRGGPRQQEKNPLETGALRRGATTDTPRINKGVTGLAALRAKALCVELTLQVGYRSQLYRTLLLEIARS